MKLSTPRWWYVRHNPPGVVTRMVLSPLSWVWAAVTKYKIDNARPVDAGLPVICVGNLTAGGVGKTPVVRELLRMLREDGIAAHGLSRGYGGNEPGPLKVDQAIHATEQVGDEPLMLAADGPFWVSRDRPAGAAAAKEAGAQAVVMDDGHQNPSLLKTLSLVVVDGETRGNEWPFGDGAVFPAGPMREPLAVGLARADAVVLLMPVDLVEPDPELTALFKGKPVLIARLEPSGPAPTHPVVAFAGIGKPWKFERSLVAAGVVLKDFAPFPDHGEYREETLYFLEQRAAELGGTLLTTEKDWVRLPGPWRRKVDYWPVRARFEDEAAVRTLLRTATKT